ncbi:hypothetical protein EV426DRAFT_573443 [Tirmania nivea]|nr:hypothetical protein EV426DRAFT_573443 [Tirmania nivea]
MSEAMMPISTDALHYRTLLFELSKPVTIPTEKFDEIWPYVDSVYTSLSGEVLQCNGTIQVRKYECRLRKSTKSSTAKVTEGKIIKRRHSSIRDKHQCHVRIKVSRPIDGTAVTIQRLDEHTYTHDIEESFQIKKPSILLGYIKSEAVKNYSPAQIYHALRGAGTHEGSERLGELGGSSLKRQDIVNLKRGMKSSDLRSLPYGKLFKDDVLQACSLLVEHGWCFQELQIIDSKKEERWGLVFAHPTRLMILERRGWFTQFDATHKLNRWGHNMFSFLVNGNHGLNAGEQEVSHILCSVHSNRTLLRRLGSTAHKPIYQLLKHAMYCFTEIHNRALCEQAIAAADEETAKYVHTYWLQTASKWAMYARQHSPFLLQVTTTNACEAWHRKLKSGAGLSKGQVAPHGIYGMILNIMDAAKDIDNRAAVAKSLFRNRKLASSTKQYPQIGQLPAPIQKLLAVEIDAVAERIEKGKELPNFDENLRCYCKFHRQYLLPCRHIFHLDTEVKVLTTVQWDTYLMMFAECGMEVYETMGTVWVEEEGGERNARRMNSVIRVRACVEQLQQQLYAIHESMDRLQLEDTVQDQRVEEWVNHVQATLGSLTSLRAEDIASRNRPWEL